jgi:hypothetical protein
MEDIAYSYRGMVMQLRLRKVAFAVAVVYPFLVMAGVWYAWKIDPQFLSDYAWGFRHRHPGAWVPTLVAIVLPIIFCAILRQWDRTDTVRGFDVRMK